MFRLLLIISACVIFACIYGTIVGEFTHAEYATIVPLLIFSLMLLVIALAINISEKQMANIEKLKFPDSKITGTNYIAWKTNVELHMEAENLSDTLKEGNKSSILAKAKALMFIRKYLDENVSHDYAHINDPSELWEALKERFDNQRDINLPHAVKEWKNLRFQDFEKVEEYYSEMLRIISQLKYFGKNVTEAEMLEKTYLTFHKEHSVLQKLYSNCGFTKFSELFVTLVTAEKRNELLIRNHNSRPTGAKAFPEVKATDVKNPEERNIKPIRVVNDIDETAIADN